MKYKEITDLIQYYAQYEEENPSGTIEGFGFWLHHKIHPKTLEEDIPEMEAEQKLALTEYYHEEGKEVQIAILLSRMPRYTRFYVKKAYGDKFNISLEEFSFLAATEGMGSPTKSELINATLTEITTGTEILKRLVKMNYLEEIANLEDKRSKRVRLTKEGSEVFGIIIKDMEKIARLVSANLTDHQKDELLKILILLDGFHIHNFFHVKEIDLEDLLNNA